LMEAEAEAAADGDETEVDDNTARYEERGCAQDEVIGVKSQEAFCCS
jgi:hypothetical protein